MNDKLQRLLSACMFITFLGQRERGALHTTPQHHEPSPPPKHFVNDACVIEVCGKWTHRRRRQYGGETYEAAMDSAIADLGKCEEQDRQREEEKDQMVLNKEEAPHPPSPEQLESFE